MTNSRVCNLCPVWFVQGRNSYQRDIGTLRIIFITMVYYPERILQFVCVSVVPAKVWLICHITISGSSGISQIKICRQVLQLKT